MWEKEVLLPWNGTTWRCCCWETRRFPAEERKTVLAAPHFLRQRREVHPWVLFSLVKGDAFRVLPTVEFLTHRDASIDCCFPYSCTGKSVFPKYDESDGQVDPEVHLGITTNQGTTLQSLIAGIFYNHRAFLPLWCVHLDVLLTTPKWSARIWFCLNLSIFHFMNICLRCLIIKAKWSLHFLYKYLCNDL